MATIGLIDPTKVIKACEARIKDVKENWDDSDLLVEKIRIQEIKEMNHLIDIAKVAEACTKCINLTFHEFNKLKKYESII
jgi:hypothetical protein